MLPGLVMGGGWVLRNRLETGTAFFDGIEGANGPYYRAAGALAMSESIPVAQARMRLAEAEVQRGARDLPPGPQVRLRTRMMVEVLAAHPLGALRAALQGWLRLFSGTGASALSALRGDPAPEGHDAAKTRLNLVLAGPLAVVLAGVLLAGVAPRAPGDRFAFALVAAIVGYFLATSSFLEANTRFRVPMAPFLCLLAARGWLALLDRTPSRERGPAEPSS